MRGARSGGWPGPACGARRGSGGRALFAAIVVLGVCAHTPAEACSTCTVGDPTLTVMGAEQPFAHRLRSAVTVRHGTHRWGRPGETAEQLSEQRLEASLSYSPLSWLSVSLLVPVVRRTLTYVNLATDERVSLADVEVRARVFVLRDRRLAPRHLGSIVFGAELPTAPRRTDPDGTSMPLEQQTGSGSVDPIAGLTYSFFADPFSVHAVSTVLVPTRGFDRSRTGTSWRTSVAAQLQPWSFLGGRIGFDTRLDQQSDEGPLGVDPNSGGFIAFASLGVVSSPVDDLVLQTTVSLPVVRAFRGEQGEGVALSAGVAFDF